MEICKRFFPEIMLDNDINYLAHLEGIISSVDEYASLEVTKSPDSYNFRLVPSLPKYTNVLIQEIIGFHNMLSIRLDMSKSIKTTSIINFQIHTT